MFIISQVEKFLSTYGWCSIKEFLLSLFPSAKYGTTVGSVSVASVSAFFVHYLGISPALVPALMIILATELFTGIRASTKRGETFQSGKFSRFVIKLCVWMVLFYVAHVLVPRREHYEHTGESCSARWAPEIYLCG